MCPQFEFSFKVHIILINSEYSDHMCNVSFEGHIKQVRLNFFTTFIHTVFYQSSVLQCIYVCLIECCIFCFSAKYSALRSKIKDWYSVSVKCVRVMQHLYPQTVVSYMVHVWTYSSL